MRIPSSARARATYIVIALSLLPSRAFASGHGFETAVANVLVWVVLVVAPVIAIGVFLAVHILPEKIAENREHPQLDAIKTLCLLSLVFGGILWPLAWIWAYTKPVMHKLAYGVDRTPHGASESEADTAELRPPVTGPAEAAEIQRLRRRVAELETMAGSGPLS